MRIAFYAPMKPPDHPVASGDRRMARLLMAALGAAGHEVELASRFRSWQGGADPARQARLATIGAALAARLVRRYRTRPAAHRPEAWFTYHLYYKAPDWLGPAVADALSIPYLVAEASHGGKRGGGPWDLGHRATARAIARADAVVTINPDDAEGLRPLLRKPGSLVALAPFLDAAPYRGAAEQRARARRSAAERWTLPSDVPWLLAVAMMRADDKLASYRLLGEALAGLMERRWHLLVVGDGPTRAAVQEAFAPVIERVRFAGALPGEMLPELYAAADLFVWPAIGEAYGMSLLEAQAAGLPAVAGASGGVAAIVADGRTGLLPPAGDAQAFAAAVLALLEAPERREAMRDAALQKVAAAHDLPSAAQRLDGIVRQAIAARAQIPAHACPGSP